jgi:hypothetical protein
MSTATLSIEQLLDLASERVRLTDYGDLPFREGIDVLVWSLQHESGLPPEQVTQAAPDLVLPALVKRLRLVAEVDVVAFGGTEPSPQLRDPATNGEVQLIGLDELYA